MTDNEVVRSHGHLVAALARHVASRGGPSDLSDDLWSVGALGLVEASHRFDPARGISFETFAKRRILGAMLDELRRMDHLSRRHRAKAKAAQQTGSEVDGALMAPTRLGAAAAMVADDGPAPDARLDQEAVRRELNEAMTSLTDRQRQVVAIYYRDQDTKMSDVAAALDCSQPNISILHTHAIRRLRKAMLGAA